MRGKSKTKSSNKNFLPVLSILALLSLGMLVYSFTLPSLLQENQLENTIHIKNDYQMVENVPPNLLYPGGTTLYPDKTLTTALASTFLIKETVTITADKPVEINAASEPILNIENIGTWEKTYPIGDKKSFHDHARDATLTIVMTIPAKELFTYLDQVEKKMDLQSNQYVFHVMPQLKGTVAYQGIQLDLSTNDGLDFEHNPNELTLNENEKLSYTKSYPIKNVMNRPNELTMGSFSIPVMTARIIFGLLSILFVLIWLLAVNRKKQLQPEYALIDRKYEKQMIRVAELPDLATSEKLDLLNFKDLLLVSDEKETPICRYESAHEVTYFVPNHQFIYSFKLPIEGRSRKR